MPDDLKMLIGGEWVDSASGATFEATSPSTGEVIARVPEGGREDAQRAIAAANAAWVDWASRSAFERAAAMRRMAEIVGERRDDLARTLSSLDQGKPHRAEAHDGVEELIVYFRDGIGRRHADRGTDPAVGRCRQAGAHLPGAPRRGGRHQPVELALHDAGRAPRTGAGVRERGGVGARPDTSMERLTELKTIVVGLD